MELLLNLTWVLLALPSYWLWRRYAGMQQGRRFSSLQCLLALGCALVLLFPVISASDDLHAMGAEMEDSAINKRTVRQTGSDKNSAWVNRLQATPAAMASAVGLAAPETGLYESIQICAAPLTGPCVFHAGRAPPLSLLG
jgi:hypothetical protein